LLQFVENKSLQTGLPDFLSWRQTLAKSSQKSANFIHKVVSSASKSTPKIAIKAPNSSQSKILKHQQLLKVAQLMPCCQIWQHCIAEL